MNWHPVVPASARGVAEFLAPLTRVLRDEVSADLTRADSPLRTVANEWGSLLFPTADDAQFADAYAQTLTYALLLAKFEGAESLRPALAVDALRGNHDLLAEALSLMEVRSVRNRLLMPVELLERAIDAIETIQFEQDDDHWLYFYEDFPECIRPQSSERSGAFTLLRLKSSGVKYVLQPSSCVHDSPSRWHLPTAASPYLTLLLAPAHIHWL